MKCLATADKPSYACETTSLQFNAIPMYQSLRATFQSKIRTIHCP